MTDQLLDMLGVPEFYATTTHLENAGGGNIRIFNCTERNGVLIPSCAVIFPVPCILRLMEATNDFARRLTLIDMEGGTAH